MTGYVEVRQWLERFIPLVYGKEELGLRRIENLLNKLGNPQKKFRSIHVGGTAGKGSTAYYIARLLKFSDDSENSESQKNQKTGKSDISDDLKVRSSEYSEFSEKKIGLHISPHLIDVRERMTINGKMPSVKRFVSLANSIRPVVEDIVDTQPQLTPSYFEILVAITFVYFSQEKVDWAVVEVGLGGRLDATNVLSPKISVITNVGLDHTEILGDTIEKIAEEKAGIIKSISNVKFPMSNFQQNGVSVITGASGKALKVIEKVAREKKAPLIKIDTQGNLKTPNSDIFGYINKQYYSFRSTHKSFASRNMNMALLTVLALGIKVDPDEVKKAFSSSYVGRVEQIDDNLILDGAHNLDKVRSLIEFVGNSKVKGQMSKVVLVIAFKKGKNWKEMVDLLLNKLSVAQVIATEYQSVTDTGKGSAVPAKEIKKYLEGKKQSCKAIINSQEAVFDAIQSTHQSKNLILVTGSLYLVGEVRTLWKLPEF